MSPNPDLGRLGLALEYADLAAALYLAGGSDEAARLLAAAAEQQLGDLYRLLGEQVQNDELQSLLCRVALRYAAPRYEMRSHAQARSSQQVLGRLDVIDRHPPAKAREATASFLRAVWYLLESMGLEAVTPQRLHQAIERSTIHASDT